MAKVIAQADAEHYLAQKTAEANKVDENNAVCITVLVHSIIITT